MIASVRSQSFARPFAEIAREKFCADFQFGASAPPVVRLAFFLLHFPFLPEAK
jgi:hypothetical protein